MSTHLVLQSWKQIADYVGRTERTLQRWEREFGFPVHRPAGKPRSAVMALAKEIHEWTRGKPSLLQIRRVSRLNRAEMGEAPGDDQDLRSPNTQTSFLQLPDATPPRFENHGYPFTILSKYIRLSQLLEDQGRASRLKQGQTSVLLEKQRRITRLLEEQRLAFRRLVSEQKRLHEHLRLGRLQRLADRQHKHRTLA